MSLSAAGVTAKRQVKRDSHAVLQAAPSLTPPPTHTHYKQTVLLHMHSNLAMLQCIMAYLICGNGGSSDEGRDGGLCNHAVGGNAVRRGVEPERGRR